jgi:hypothetical protein
VTRAEARAMRAAIETVIEQRPWFFSRWLSLYVDQLVTIIEEGGDA